MTLDRSNLVPCLSIIALILSSWSPIPAGGPEPVDYNRAVRPILSNNCLRCHGPDEAERKAGLRLDRRESALEAVDGGKKVLVPGKPEESALIARINASSEGKPMPPPETGKRLTGAEKELLRQWIAEGAEYRDHWAFTRPRRPPLPEVRDGSWPRNPVDRFILARLEAEGLQPSPEAPRTALIRRLSLDLTGLPPTLGEVDAFLADPGPDSYASAVDRLLASPRSGERMALEWLDAARFADTNGYHIDNGRDMTRWRDWVIDSFNRNVPFDRFTIDQIAGDLLPGATREQRIASGFNRNHMINFEGGAIPEEYHAAYIVDRVNTTATVWLGLTVACTQCHDHKYDPMTQKEFYRLFAFFHNVPENGLDGNKGNAAPLLRVPGPGEEASLARLSDEVKALEEKLSAPWPEVDAAQAEWEASAPAREEKNEKEALPAEVRKALGVEPEKRGDAERTLLRKHFRAQVSPAGKEAAAKLARLTKERDELDARIPTAMVMQEMEKPRDTFVLVRGQYDKKGEKVAAGVPAFLHPLPADAPPNRLGLARWLVDPANPLTARVIVNRWWQMLFGTGLVKTSEDFGSQGELPSHPELLDWLAVEFVESGWDVKRLVRLLVGSAAYRQSSAVEPRLLERDSENRLLARGPRFRLQAELIRDQALAVSGLLDERIGGPSVSPYQPPGLWEELASREDGKNWTAQTYVQSQGRDLYRRGMYTFWKRTSPPPTLVIFDAPDRETCTVRRPRTNTPLQALILLNDPTYVEAARKLAERMVREGGAGPSERIAHAFRLCTSRPPEAAEAGLLLEVFEGQLAAFRKDVPAALELLAVGESPRDVDLDSAELAAFSVVASMVLNLDETLTR